MAAADSGEEGIADAGRGFAGGLNRERSGRLPWPGSGYNWTHASTGFRSVGR